MATHKLGRAFRNFRKSKKGLEDVRNVAQCCYKESNPDNILDSSIHARSENRNASTRKWSFSSASFLLPQ